MTTEEMQEALEHDLAQKGMAHDSAKPLVLARYCLQNAAVAARAAEGALVVCQPPAVAEAMRAAQLAVASLEQALILLGSMETKNE